jgi:hypothetical protein
MIFAEVPNDLRLLSGLVYGSLSSLSISCCQFARCLMSVGSLGRKNGTVVRNISSAPEQGMGAIALVSSIHITEDNWGKLSECSEFLRQCLAVPRSSSGFVLREVGPRRLNNPLKHLIGFGPPHRPTRNSLSRCECSGLEDYEPRRN